MDSSKIVFLINDQVRLIRVSYDEGTPVPSGTTVKTYQVKTLDQSIKVDDLVLVETATRHGLAVCKVVAVDLDVDFDDGISLKWAFGGIDLARIEEIRAQEADAITAAKRAELRRQREKLRGDIFAEHAEIISGLSLATKTLPAE